ncbi:MAG: alcohol dehydrogenase catalytic domain-containing protein [Planctomycetota bacterium]|nr:alcohol dehydrogenase catalytic domain-containing protein [Planctomycetota bacterium]
MKVLFAGVCATDLALLDGYMGFAGVPGHEFVGRLADGPDAGALVTGEINAACGVCPICLGEERPLSGGALDGRHCGSRSVLGILGRQGAMASELLLPSANLRAVPAGVSPEQATFAEPLAAAFEVLEQLGEVRGRRALVAGDGRLGLLIAQVLREAGCSVDLAGHHPERTPAEVGERCGLLDAAATPTLAERYDLAVEATGRPEVLQRLFAWVRPRGTVVLKTTSASRASLDLAPVVVDELTLLGSRCGPFEPALAALASGAVQVDSMIHATLPLGEVDQAFALAARPGVLKVLIDCR